MRGQPIDRRQAVTVAGKVADLLHQDAGDFAHLALPKDFDHHGGGSSALAIAQSLRGERGQAVMRATVRMGPV